MRDFSVFMSGPKDTPYEHGTFKLHVTLPTEYPFKAPIVKFDTPVFHCNVCTRGSICLDFLQSKWTPSCMLGGLLLTVQSLLADPNPNSPLNGKAARMLNNNPETHDLYVRRHVFQYAGGPDPDAPAAEEAGSDGETVPPASQADKVPDQIGGGGEGGGGSSEPSDAAPPGPPEPIRAPVVDLSCDETLSPPSPRRKKRSRSEGEMSYSKRSRSAKLSLEELAQRVRDEWVDKVNGWARDIPDCPASKLDDLWIADLNYHDPVAVAMDLLGGFPEGWFRATDFLAMHEAAESFGEAAAERLRRAGLDVITYK